MFKLKTIDFDNAQTSSQELKIELANDNVTLENGQNVAQVLQWQLAKRRSGSANTKTMSEISGTTAKPYKQKGTGSARQGSKRSVQFRGGRACFGPRVRSFEYAIPKKIVKNALSDALRLKIKEDKLVLFSAAGQGLKTAQINKVLQENKIADALLVYNKEDGEPTIKKAAKNLKNIKLLDFAGFNVYDILRSEFLMVDKALFDTIKKVVL
jgi:large subunit ribosomal protein L4